jgi:lysophospholipase L1-like esterase
MERFAMPSTPQIPCTIVAFGDSITQAVEVEAEQRWVMLLQAKLQQCVSAVPVRVVNAGVGGNTSREGIARIEESVLAHHPDLVLVEFGGNDATMDTARHVHIEEYRSNLDVIRRKIVEEAGAVMMLLTFPPIVDAWHKWGQHDYFRNAGGLDACIEPYRQYTRDYARSQGITLIEIDHALREAAGNDRWERYLRPDGVHLTAEGNAVVMQTVYPPVAAWFCAR